MIIDLGPNRKYIILWQHVNPTSKNRRKKTSCFIKPYVLAPEGSEHKLVRTEPIASATIKCDSRDCFNKNKGRKETLKRAFAQVADMFTKPERTAIWQQYREMRNGSWI